MAAGHGDGASVPCFRRLPAVPDPARAQGEEGGADDDAPDDDGGACQETPSGRRQRNYGGRVPRLASSG